MRGYVMAEKEPRSKIPLYDLKLSREAISRVNRVLKSGWLTTGSQVGEFERALARRAKARYVAAFSSATHALQADAGGAGG